MILLFTSVLIKYVSDTLLQLLQSSLWHTLFDLFDPNTGGFKIYQVDQLKLLL